MRRSSGCRWKTSISLPKLCSIRPTRPPPCVEHFGAAIVCWEPPGRNSDVGTLPHLALDNWKPRPSEPRRHLRLPRLRRRGKRLSVHEGPRGRKHRGGMRDQTDRIDPSDLSHWSDNGRDITKASFPPCCHASRLTFSPLPAWLRFSQPGPTSRRRGRRVAKSRHSGRRGRERAR